MSLIAPLNRFFEKNLKAKKILRLKMSTKNSLQDWQIKSVPILNFQNFLFQIVT